MSTSGNSFKIIPYLLVFIGIILAFYLGNLVADENYAIIGGVISSFLLIYILFGYASSLYLLIPICWSLTGSIRVLPIPFSVRQLVIIFATFIYIQNRVFSSKKRIKYVADKIDFWVWINIAYILTVFIRNPVGINALGGDLVGGKPYADVILGLFSYLILREKSITPINANKIPYWILMASLFTGFAGAVGAFFPLLGDRLAFMYSGFSGSGLVGIELTEQNIGEETRFAFLQTTGVVFVLFVVSKINPLRIFSSNYLYYNVQFLAGLVMILLSGFRNSILQVILMTSVSAFFREKFLGIVKIISIAFFLVVMAIVISFTNLSLPYSFQRALCWMPGNWDQRAVIEAKGSSDWRLDMWKELMSSNRYIRNKILGDGFGYLRSDYERSIDLAQGIETLHAGEMQQEMFMLNGDYHSGPISTIKYVGYIGLCIFITLLVITAFYAFRIISISIGTPYQFISLFIGIPIVIHPIIFILVFGDYRADVVSVLFNIGTLKMISNSLKNTKFTG